MVTVEWFGFQFGRLCFDNVDQALEKFADLIFDPDVSSVVLLDGSTGDKIEWSAFSDLTTGEVM